MLKRNLFKRALPVLLSLVMAFESVPMTAIAAEDLSAVMVTKEAETDDNTAAETDVDAGADIGTGITAETDDGAGTDAGTGTDAAAGMDTKADPDIAQSGQESQSTVGSTEIVVNSSILEHYLASDFVRDKGESRLTYTVAYEEDKTVFDGVLEQVKRAATIKINDNLADLLTNDYLILEWKEIKKAEDGTETLAAMTGLPQNAGSYVLQLRTREMEGVCGAAENNVYFNMTPVKLEIVLGSNEADTEKLLTVKAGSKIADFKKTVEEACVLMAGSAPYKAQQYDVAVKVCKIGDADEAAETTALFFDKYDDYRVRIEVTLPDALHGNYEVNSGKEYLVRFADLLATRVEVEIKNPGSEIVKTYEKGKTYKTSEIAAAYGLDFAVKVESEDRQGNTVYVPFGDDVAEADKQAHPKWYGKESNKDANANPSITDFPTKGEVDGNTRFYWQDSLYTLMEEESVGEVGEYYLVYVYEGVDGQYGQSHSDPIKVSIDPVDVILVPTKAAQLKTGMTNLALRKALAEVESELRKPDAAEDSLASAEKSDAPFGDKDFYGVSYEDTAVTQYYRPVFELVRQKRTRLPQTQWPENVTEDQKWSEWSFEKVAIGTDSNTADLKVSDDKTEYKYYIRFTGQKAVYTANGQKTNERPVAEATDAANRNYKVKADSDTLDREKNMLAVTLDKSAETSIDVSAIIAEFNKAGGRGKGGGGLLADDPAWTIYDADAALFADKSSYKKAVVTGTTIKNTHKDIKYTWQSSSAWEQYAQISRMEQDENETEEAFAKRKEEAVKAFENTFRTNVSAIPQNAGLYRLHITYQDSSLDSVNAPAAGDVYFWIKQQELMLVADMQYAAYDTSVNQFTKRGYRIFALPDNDESNFNPTTAVALNWQVAAGDLHWQAVNLKKNADGSNTTRWEASTGTFIRNETHPYVYKAAVWLDNGITGVVYDTDDNTVTNKAGKALSWSNYTTRNMALWDAEQNGYREHIKVGEGFGDIRFDAPGIAIAVDRSKLFADKVYDGKTIASALPEGFVTLTQKETGEEISASVLKIDETFEDGTGVVHVGWKWVNGNNQIVPTGEVRYGGSYRLVARFGGNDTYGPFEKGDWTNLVDKDGRTITLTIMPLAVEIAPILKTEATAGEPVSSMVEDWHINVKTVTPGGKIPDGTDGSSDDRWLFERGDGSRWNAITGSEGSYADSYPILGNAQNEKNRSFTSHYFENGQQVSASTGLIRYGKTYDVTFDHTADLFAQYQLSYNLTFRQAGLSNINRGDGEVQPAAFFEDTITNETSGLVSVHSQKDADGTHRIVPREGIPFVYDGYRLKAWVVRGNNAPAWETVRKDLTTGEPIPLNKNYIAVDLVSPREFAGEFVSSYDFSKNNFVYRNSIKDAGGYVIAEYGKAVDGVKRFFITALFPVELDRTGKMVSPQKKFSVTWEKGYTEHFNVDLSYANVEANLMEAAAPKSLAFNGVQTKMAVGEEQQLDVKITKAQLGDVIRIRYRLVGGLTSNAYASIDPDTGRLTALAANNKKPVAVTVEAYPARLMADGKTYEEITGNGAKVAKTKITVTEVTSPVIKKVVPTDVSAEVQFSKVDNGYRGELYVVKLENKKDANKWKAADFEAAIGKMKNSQWQGTFAVKPMYFAGTRGYSETLKVCRQQINGLERGSYVVYVRNVSAVRTLADGSKVTESAAGTVKTFETTKSQVKGLTPYFKVEAEKSRQNPVRYYNGKDASDGYVAELADQSAQLWVNGWFLAKLLDDAADLTERRPFLLSLKAAEKELGVKLTDKYLDPKLSYYVTDDGSLSFDGKHKLANPSKYVTISNKGKLTFKGVGQDGVATVYVWAVADNGVQQKCKLTVTARPDTLTAKKVKTMKVGDAVRLADYLEYKQGRLKITGYWSSNIQITNREALEAAGFRIDQAVADGETHPSVDGKLRKGEYIIIAEKDGAKCDVKFRDWLWKPGTDEKVRTAEMAVSLVAAKLDPVKGLKAVYTDDNNITLNFTHAGHPEAFDIEVKDARGSVVYKRLAYRERALKNTIAASEPVWRQKAQYAAELTFRYYEKTKTYAYTVHTEKLMRRSSYTITVTPVYEGERAAKPASAKAKTTDIPASYQNLDIVNPKISGGINIENLSTYLTSGNTYTLVAGQVQTWAKERGTDTLTWKSSNTKVASVKANQGSYSATLKAMQQGKTTITVTSKVTKKTIARYHVAVKAVGNGSVYGGDYENAGAHDPFYGSFIKTVDPYYEGKTEVLTVSNPVRITEEDLLMREGQFGNKERTWVQFTAPSYGEYTFACKDADGYFNHSYEIYYSNAAETGSVGKYSAAKTLRLEEGQTIYFKVADTFKLNVTHYTDFTKLTVSYTKDKPLKTGANEVWISFTAPEDNYYTFYGEIERYEQDGSRIYPVNNSHGMKAGETIFLKVRANSELYVTKRDLTKVLKTGGDGIRMTFTADNAEDTQYVSFKADVTGDYNFTYSPSDLISAEFLAVDGSVQYIDGSVVLAKKNVMADFGVLETPAEQTTRLLIEGGETVVIAVKAKNPLYISDDTKKVFAAIKVTSTAVKTLESEQTVEKGTSRTFSYTIPDDKTAAQYTLAATNGAEVVWYYGKPKSETGNAWESDTELGEIGTIAVNDHSFTVEDGKVITPVLTGKKSLYAGDRIYIKVTAKTADSKVTLTRTTSDKTFDLSAPITIELGTEIGSSQWHTFIAKKAGYYEFAAKVTTEPAGSSAGAQNLTIEHVIQAFSDECDYEPYIGLYGGNGMMTSSVVKLEAGTYVFKTTAISAAAKNVRTTVNLSAREIVPTVLVKGDTQVTLAAGETKYYSFQATTNDKYTIKWVPDAESKDAEIWYTTGDLRNEYENMLHASVPVTFDFSQGICFIKAASAEGKAASGKLLVETEEKKFIISAKTACQKHCPVSAKGCIVE